MSDLIIVNAGPTEEFPFQICEPQSEGVYVARWVTKTLAEAGEFVNGWVAGRYGWTAATEHGGTVGPPPGPPPPPPPPPPAAAKPRARRG